MFFSPSSEILNTRNPSKISNFCIRPEKFEQLHDVTDVSSVGQEKKTKNITLKSEKEHRLQLQYEEHSRGLYSAAAECCCGS